MVSFQIYVYGKDEKKIDEIRSDLSSYSTNKILNDFDTNAVSEILSSYYGTQGVMLINADAVKRINVAGTDNISTIITKIESLLKSPGGPYMILFNRFQDNNVQTHYIGELVKSVSIFRSFNPKGSDCIYISGKALPLIKSSIESGTNATDVNLFSRIDSIEAFSFNPNLYIFRLEDSAASSTEHQLKSSIIKCEGSRSISKTIELFFSNHILLFWVFLVFFICSIFIVSLRIFKVGCGML
jgi:hypothetical protein